MPAPLLTSTQRLEALQINLRERALDLWVQPTNDEFQGEYVPEYAERLAWISGFTGSAGTGLVVCDGPNALLTDGRYTLQAAKQLDAARWQVVNSGKTTLPEWVAEHRAAGAIVGLDAWLHTHAQVTRWEKALAKSKQVLKACRSNPVDAVWQERPAVPVSDVMILPERYAGRTVAEKIGIVTAAILKHHADALLVTQPDVVCWLLNIRAADIPYNPLLLAYALVLRDGRVVLLTHPRAFAPEIVAHFEAHRVSALSFAEWFENPTCVQRYLPEKSMLALEPDTAPHALWLWAEERGLKVVEVEDPLALPKAAKHAAEQAGMREAHVKDGVALAHFLAEFDSGAGWDELRVARVLEQHRARAETFRGPSFATIAGSGPHGAIVHYRATEESNRALQKGEFFLLDSGGQYLEGTTDITRTFAIGDVTEEMKDRYTRVLKGHIALARARFPRGTTGHQLDALARQYLWEIGCDYDHGTGHGVGSFLCVHEGPQRIGKKAGGAALVPGMVVSNEPGFYKDDAYGIRIESLVMVVEAEENLAFETITLCPIDTAPILRTLLAPDEIAWLNAYHAEVFATLSKRITDGKINHWLQKSCAPL
jgi:Xaa-Pro aminopeptidase